MRVDPVGACVGARGARVKSIVRELGGEKIDIVRYHEDPQEMLAEALKPVEACLEAAGFSRSAASTSPQ